MRFLSIISLAASVSAAATGLVARQTEPNTCLGKADVDYLVEAYKSILNQWEPAKAEFLADEGFFDYSDSINTVAGLSTGFPIFPNKTAFVGYQSTTVGIYTCFSSSYKANSRFPAGQYPPCHRRSWPVQLLPNFLHLDRDLHQGSWRHTSPRPRH